MGIDSHTMGLAVIYQCGLTRDLALFDAGDQTEVGEKGITLRYAVRPCGAWPFDSRGLPTVGVKRPVFWE